MISKKIYGLSTVLQNLVFIGSITSVQTFFVGGLANETVINIVVEVVTPLTEETKCWLQLKPSIFSQLS